MLRLRDMSISRAEIFGVIALFALITFASTYKLAESPGVWSDEGYLLQASKSLAIHGAQFLQVAPGQFVSTASVTVGYPLLAPIALSFKLFGIGLLQARVVMAFYILAFCAASYALMRVLFNPRMALWSLAPVAGFAQLYGNGRAVLGEVPGLFFFMLTLLMLDRLERSGYRDMRLYAFFGLSAGLSFVTKPIFILMLPAFLIAYLVRYRSIPIRITNIVVCCGAFAAPILVWFFLQFGSDAAFSDVVNFYANPYGSDNIPSLIVQNLKRFVTEQTTLFTLVVSAAWAVALYLRRTSVRVAEIAAFAFCLVVTLAYLRTPGWYRYLFPATTIALVFFAPSVAAIYERMAGRVRISGRWRFLPYIAIGALALVLVIQLFTTSYVAGYFGSTRTEALETHIATLPKDATIYFYDVPEVAFFAPSERYYQYINPDHEFGIIGADTLPYLADSDYVVMLASASTSVDVSGFEPLQAANRYIVFKQRD